MKKKITKACGCIAECSATIAILDAPLLAFSIIDEIIGMMILFWGILIALTFFCITLTLEQWQD